MKQAKCMLDKDNIIGTTDSRLFGALIEHLGRGVYSGIYDPADPSADVQGFRRNVLDLVRQLRVSVVRYPGGNFVSGYHWSDGIGPEEDRPARLNLAWKSLESNRFGFDEFVDWAKKAGAETMAAVNLGTGTPEDAGYLVEYCNHPSGTKWSDLRRKNGHDQPHNIKIWCLGNEMGGYWQIGRLSAEDYGKKAMETAKMMRLIDPSIELLACGSSTTRLSSYPEWDRVVLEYLYDQIDYISIHHYYGYDNELGDYLGSFVDMDRFIRTIIATTDYVKALKRTPKILGLSFDEWNVWYHQPISFPTWEWDTAPKRLEQIYTLLDALVVGGLICTLLRHADRVKIACVAQLVNVIAPILTGPGGRVIKQSIFHPLQQVSIYGRGQVLNPLMTCPRYASKMYGDVPILQLAAVFNQDAGMVSLFILNCDQWEDTELSLDFRSFGPAELLEHILLNGPDLGAANSFSDPERVKPRALPVSPMNTDQISVVLPKLSWNMLRFSLLTSDAGKGSPNEVRAMHY